ncbi:FAD binding domain-containing protein [Pseudaminobacter sp. 19-2017]|uniref:FAD binding domain-containing protein n=1 Tax=Pseudaminobacter soli (ex Zhang et al. 2022) TaxID=2831468 RepID=A0A942E6Z4_9HYPH|nr:FAD binding domain-containing protein [Pseudaminobacter soli]MBS3651630.1 FAD binding domain-containing protein [Pseudaminobacter soli]
MKPVDFRYSRPGTIPEAIELLNEGAGGAKIMAGGQSLGPMLNLRLAQPEQIVDITAIPALTMVTEERDAVVFGACITHAAFEDGRVPDPANGFLRRVAGGIAYRAVRNRGTIGGSLVHADPAADWITTLTALDAELIVATAQGERRVALEAFMMMAFGVHLDDGEFLAGIRIRKFSPAARFGYYKFCRKRGEFAEAMAAVVIDPALNIYRGVIGATQSRPLVLDDIRDLLRGGGESSAPNGAALARARDRVADLGIDDDPITDAMHGNAFARALEQVIA